MLPEERLCEHGGVRHVHGGDRCARAANPSPAAAAAAADTIAVAIAIAIARPIAHTRRLPQRHESAQNAV